MTISLNHSFAGEPAHYVISCDKVEAILVELGYDLETFERRVIGCEVELTPAAEVELDTHCAKWFGAMLPITAGGLQIAIYDSTTRSIPPQFVFMEETWKDTKTKLMAICPDKIPRIPQQVLDHRPAVGGHLT
ncbi:MAG: hypothetical protein JEY79_16665 [Pseudodesulfovibrio sp.]|nr:hypothetical protein [Pseudodesulfovibrio sp.]